jgi:CheY-like chemotaxis protein
MLEPILSPSHAPVILVDDEGLYLRAVCRGLEQRGHTVVACSDLETAEAAYHRMVGEGCHPALVVDLIQPGENNGHLGGLDLLRRLRPAPGRPVVAVMDSDAAWLEQAARSLGATRVVRKPDLRRFEPEHLDQALNRYTAAIVGEPVSTRDEPGSAAMAPAAPASPAAPAVPAGQVASLVLGALEELRHMRDRAGVLLLLMRLASELAARGMLLEVSGDHLKVLGCFGADAVAAGDILPLDRDSLTTRAFWSARLQRGRQVSAGDLPGGLEPAGSGEAIAMPILGPDGVVAVLYADAGINGGSLPDLRPLMTLAGTARMALASVPAQRS